ncbi:MAG: methionyl-tRNA formyltransferase [Actinomycetota bacterium]
MRVVFFGTPAIALAALEALLGSHHEVTGVVTQPDRPRGRSGAPQPSPVKDAAVAAAVPVLQPVSPKDQGFARALAARAPDACAVVAYGHLLPPAVLAIPPKGTVNVHFSLLPRWRGAAPVQRAIMAGDARTGVSVFVLEPTLDTGPVIDVTDVPIDPDDTAGTLLERLAPIGAGALLRALDAIESGQAKPVPQQSGGATPAPKIKPEEGLIDWSQPAGQIRNRIRALNPSPGAFTFFRGERLKVWAAAERPGDGSPGAFLGSADALVVAAGDGALEVLQVQPGGKRRMSGAEFARGRRPSAEDHFGA